MEVQDAAADLDALEARAIHVLREAHARLRPIAMLWSVGKDSNVLLWLARKAFLGRVPFVCALLDTGDEFPEVYALRDELVRRFDLECVGVPCPPVDATDPGLPPAARAAQRKTLGLRNFIAERDLAGLLLGIRADEQAVRAKESYASPRDGRRYRTIGERSITLPIVSNAADIDSILAELAAIGTPERAGCDCRSRTFCVWAKRVSWSAASKAERCDPAWRFCSRPRENTRALRRSRRAASGRRLARAAWNRRMRGAHFGGCILGARRSRRGPDRFRCDDVRGQEFARRSRRRRPDRGGVPPSRFRRSPVACPRRAGTWHGTFERDARGTGRASRSSRRRAFADRIAGCGKSTLAASVERRLFDLGWRVFVLGGDNLRHGLNADLGFSPGDRAENIRRAGEVAAFFPNRGR